MKTLQVRDIPDETYRQLRVAAAGQDMSVSEYVRTALDALAADVKAGRVSASEALMQAPRIAAGLDQKKAS